MMRWLVESGLRFGRLMVAAAIGVLAVGVFQLHQARVDAYPEFGPTAVQVQAEALGLSAAEVEQLITVPLEQDLLNGIPWLEHIRSKSMPGLSAIDLEFEPGTDLYQARQMVQERMSQAKALPNVGTPPVMVQPTSSTSRVAMISMSSTTVSTMEMSVQARWQIRPRLMSIPGVANVSIWGQRDRQLQVQVDPARLRTHQVTLTQLIESTGNALWVSPLSFVEASTPGTGGFVETPSQRLGVQHIQPISKASQLANVAVENSAAKALTIGDVATVRENYQPLIGDANFGGSEGLMLVVERFPGADTAQVTHDVEEALEVMAPGLSGISVDPTVFRPADYLSNALQQLGVLGLVALGALVVASLALLWSWRMALIVTLTVPVSLLPAAWVVQLTGNPLTFITLLGLATASAVIVDDVVGDVSEIRRRLGNGAAGAAVTSPSKAAVVTDVVLSRRGPLLFATVIIVVAVLPLLSVGGLFGAFARPAVTSFLLALGVSTLVALVVTPALALLLLGREPERARVSPAEQWVQRGFDRLAVPVIRRPLALIVAAVILFVGAVAVTAIDGPGDSLPRLRDRDVVVRLQAAPGTALPEMQRISSAMATELGGLPGVDSAGAHAGRAILSDEIVDVNSAEVWLRLDPGSDFDATLASVRATVHSYAGLATDVRGYADDRVQAEQPATGADQDLVVRVYGIDLPTLRNTADGVRQLLTTVPGVLTPRVQPQASEPTVEIKVDLAAAQRQGLRPGDVRREASTLISGLAVGSIYEEQKIFDVVVWGGPPTRQSVQSLEALLIDTPSGGHVRLGDVAQIRVAPQPAVIAHDAVSRSVDVSAQVHGRDLSEVSAEVTQRLRGMSMPYEYRAEVVGTAVQAQHDQRQLIILTLLAAGVVFLLLQAATSSWRAAGALFLAVPVALVGALLVAPTMSGITSLGVIGALVALLTLTLRQSLVFVRTVDSNHHERPMHRAEAVSSAARQLAPSVISVALITAAIMIVPAVLGPRPGLEILHPFAVTLLCGLVTSVAVVLLLVPAAYLAATRNVREARSSAPLADSPSEVL